MAVRPKPVYEKSVFINCSFDRIADDPRSCRRSIPNKRMACGRSVHQAAPRAPVAYGWPEALPVPGYTPMMLKVSPAAIRACNWACVYTALVSPI